VPVWTEDEAGPYQAIPQPGSSWQKEAEPTRQPHEYIRGGTAKMLTLFRPKTGEVRALAVEHATNAILHPWLKQQLSQILSQLPAVDPTGTPVWGHSWSDWGDNEENALRFGWPPVRMVLILDNLAGHCSVDLLFWCYEQGIVLLFTPLGGSWLNLCESVQRILVRRALSGQHPQTAEEIKEWLSATVRGWNADPTPFEWAGKRWQRRQRQRERHRLGGSAGYTIRPIRRRWQAQDRRERVCYTL